MRIVFLLALCASIEAQTPTSYSLVLAIPADPARSLGAANGLLPMLADLGQGNLAPGGFFTISAIAQFADGRMAFTCGVDPSLVRLQLRPDSGPVVNLTAIRLPAGFGNPRPGCEPVAAVLPLDTSLGPAELTLSYLQINAALRVQVYAAWVALLTPLDQQLTNPYLSGDTVYLRTSGLGAMPLGDIAIVAGGIDAPVIAREPDLSQQGFDRISFRMPDNAAETCYLPVYLRTSTGETTSVFVPKANQPGPCRHPWGLDAAALTTLDNGGRIWVGQPQLLIYERQSLVQGTAIFQQVERWRMAQIVAPDDSRPCRFMPPTPIVVPPDVMRTTLGDAGGELGLVSSRSEFQAFKLQQSTLTYTARFSEARPYAGEWTLKVPGGQDIGAFETRIDVGDAPAWAAPQRIDRSADLTLTWNTDGLTSLDRLTIAAGSGFGPFIECRATADVGTLTIPARYLGRLPASAQGLVSMVISRPSDHQALFPMPLANGSAAVGVFDYRVISTVTGVPIE